MVRIGTKENIFLNIDQRYNCNISNPNEFLQSFRTKSICTFQSDHSDLKLSRIKNISN